jgi:ATP-dependent Clp protease ATP-binding subunit ClpC
MNNNRRTFSVMQRANAEATALGHDYLGTEHILLGLASAAGTVAAAALADQGAGPDQLRTAISRIVSTGPPTNNRRRKPQTPRAKKGVEYAIEEACALGHHSLGPEHVLLAVLRVGDGLALQTLRSLGAKVQQIQRTVLDGLEQV